MTLPINEKDLEKIIKSIKTTQPELYARLWSYKMNFLKKEK